MAGPIGFTFDFASPYAYFAMGEIERLAAAHQREIRWRPVLMWAVLKAQGIAVPTASSVKWDYLVRDMARSSEFYGLPYSHPPQLPISAHLATRLYYAVEHDRPERALPLAKDLFRTFFVDGLDIADRDVLCEVAARHGLSRAEALEAMDGAKGRERLSLTVDAAVADGVCGSPFFILDGEGFFGADRLPQLAWRLSSRTAIGDTATVR